jgi:polysaccharide export outer membrane protein
MTVFNVPEMTQRQRVDENGNYGVPLVGGIHVAGLTVQQAQALIASKLDDGKFVRGASVSLLISDFATQGVSVMGEVSKPGVYPVWGERHLFDLIAEAGGVTERAGKVATITHRDTAAGVQAFDFGKGDARDANTNPLVAPGDTIMIPKVGIVYVLGEVGRPGGFPLDGSEGLSLLQVLSLAQGTTKTAKIGGARLIRKTPDGRKEIALNLKEVEKGRGDDLRMLDGDIVYIPNSAIKTIADRTLPQIVAGASTAAIYTGLHY